MSGEAIHATGRCSVGVDVHRRSPHSFALLLRRTVASSCETKSPNPLTPTLPKPTASTKLLDGSVLKREWKRWIESGGQISCHADCWRAWEAWVDELILLQRDTSKSTRTRRTTLPSRRCNAPGSTPTPMAINHSDPFSVPRWHLRDGIRRDRHWRDQGDADSRARRRGTASKRSAGLPGRAPS